MMEFRERSEWLYPAVISSVCAGRQSLQTGQEDTTAVTLTPTHRLSIDMLPLMQPLPWPSVSF